MRLDKKDTGIYFLIDDYADIAARFPSLKQAPMQDPVVYSLGFGGRLDEAAAVFYSAYALTVAFNGIALETQGGTLADADTLLEHARLFHEMAAIRILEDGG
jgi:hypothetical protein